MECSRRRVSFSQDMILLFSLDFTLEKAGQVSASCLAQVWICSNKRQQKVSGQNSFQIPVVIKDRCTWNTSGMPLPDEREHSELRWRSFHRNNSFTVLSKTTSCCLSFCFDFFKHYSIGASCSFSLTHTSIRCVKAIYGSWFSFFLAYEEQPYDVFYQRSVGLGVCSPGSRKRLVSS